MSSEMVSTSFETNLGINSNKRIGSPSGLTYCIVDNENIESVILTTDDIRGIIAGKRPDINLDPQEKIIGLKVIRNPISYSTLTHDSVVHKTTILYTNSATYAVEKFDYGIKLTKGDTLDNILRSKEISSFERDQRYKAQVETGKDSIGCLLEYLLNKGLDVRYNVFKSNCIDFTMSLWRHLTGGQDIIRHTHDVDIGLIRFMIALIPEHINPLKEVTSPLSEATSISPKPKLKDRVHNWVRDHFHFTSICHMNKAYALQAVCVLYLLYFSWGHIHLMIAILLLTICANYKQASVILGRIRDFYRTRCGHFGTDFKAIIDENLSLPPNKFRVTLFCDKAKKFGEHARLFFEWHDNDVKQFATAELSIAKHRSIWNIFRGQPIVKIKQARNVEQGRNLLKGLIKPFFVTFERLGNVQKYLDDLERENHTFSSFGDSSITRLNSRDNNQNCASWCILALKKMDIVFDEPPMKTPFNIVLSARRHKDRIIRQLITDSIPPSCIIKIYVVCNPEVEFGGHAFLLFEWACKENDVVVRKFFRAELTVEGSNPSDKSLGKGKPKKSKFVIGPEEGRNLLGLTHPYFACFSYGCEGNIEERLRNSYMFTCDPIVYNKSGQNSLTQLSKDKDVHNCATFIEHVLMTDFDIDLGLDKIRMITTPMELVDLADQHEQSE